MSEREKAIQLLNAIEDEKMIYVVGILENLTGFAEIPNAETLEAFAEVDEMKRTGTGQHFTNLDDLWESLEG
ncbi:MAG: hypothetical protein HFG32_07845 [Eubacterium sp.]|jgi:hypothetical protein|nr:hypothetical protein [Eubacterium sp.]